MNQPDPRRWAALAVLCTANFMVILDSQIVLLALPSIDRALGFAAGNAQWVLTAYMLSFGGLLLLGGRVADLAGRRRVFLCGTALFLVSSLLCGLAWTPAMLIGARVLQGVSAALMAPSALSLVLTTFPDGAERNRAIAAWSSVGGIGATAALIVGGALTRALGWPWVFFLNVPVAAGLLLAGAGLLRESRERTARGFDVTGAVTVTAALACGLLALTRAPVAGWTSPWTLVLLAVSAGLFLVFAATERRSAAPLVPLGLFRSRLVTGGNLVTLAGAMAVFGTSLTVSEYAQRELGLSPLAFGLAATALPVLAIVGASAGQAAVTRFGYRPVAVAGLVSVAVGCLMLTMVSPGGSYLLGLVPGLALVGFGLGSGGLAGSTAALAGAAEPDAGVASGVNTAAFQVGGAIGVAALSTVATTLADGPAFAVAAALAALGALAGATTLKPRRLDLAPQAR
ncbi:MFS transporter [Amycolatopsis sp. NBC_01480]|uniref:MFS transporter n=1 Tax=Amycolatopsis sp. NBC_01480 TaxID=2903562 RepID=UPI002E2B5602|nr:MFS transporter [Amycolatopsis sp. NBC_01480]